MSFSAETGLSSSFSNMVASGNDCRPQSPTVDIDCGVAFAQLPYQDVPNPISIGSGHAVGRHLLLDVT
jgi:hypothetical protein